MDLPLLKDILILLAFAVVIVFFATTFKTAFDYRFFDYGNYYWPLCAESYKKC